MYQPVIHISIVAHLIIVFSRIIVPSPVLILDTFLISDTLPIASRVHPDEITKTVAEIMTGNGSRTEYLIISHNSRS